MQFFIGNCRKCGYSLARLPEPRCPECGTPFDPEDPRTMEFNPSPVLKFLRTKNSVWTVFPLILVSATLIGARFGHYVFLAQILAIPMIVILMATSYVVYARVRFQGLMRRRQKSLERESKSRAS